MHENTKCAVIIEGNIIKWFEVLIGVRQGCLLYPTLFNIFLEFVMKEIHMQMIRCYGKLRLQNLGHPSPN